jgi:hypothetical protein
MKIILLFFIHSLGVLAALFDLSATEYTMNLEGKSLNEFQAFAVRISKCGLNEILSNKDLEMLSALKFFRLEKHLKSIKKLRWLETFDLSYVITDKACFSDVLAWLTGLISSMEIDRLSHNEFFELYNLRASIADEEAFQAYKTFEFLNEAVFRLKKYKITNSQLDKFFRAVQMEMGSLVMDFEHCSDFIDGDLVDLVRDIFKIYHLPSAMNMFGFHFFKKKIYPLYEIRIHKLKSNQKYNESLLKAIWYQQNVLQLVSIRFLDKSIFFWRRGQINQVENLKNLEMHHING